MINRNILCAYNGSNTAVDSLRYAIEIAKHRDSWLTGIVRHGRPVIEARFSSHLPDDVIKAMRENDKVQIRDITNNFNEEVASNGLINQSEFIEIRDSEDLSLGAFARSYDLMVTGVPSEDMSVAHLAAHPDMVALHSGRPVIVVPDDYEQGLADHAVVAWDGKRSAARALGDAMSVLQEKAKVTVLCIGKEAPKGSDRLVGNLKRRGIHVELMIKPKQHSIGQTVLNTTKEIGAQLIVMGAYEHSKLSHDIFGGPTTDVLRNTKVPGIPVTLESLSDKT